VIREAGSSNVRAVERALQILGSFDHIHPERGISEIAKAVGKPRAYIDQRLSVLRREGRVGRRREATFPPDHPFVVRAKDRRERVKQRRLEGWTNAKIAAELEIEPAYAAKIAGELMATGEIPRRRELNVN